MGFCGSRKYGLLLLVVGMLFLASCQAPGNGENDTGEEVDKSALLAKIASAEALLAILEISVDGADVRRDLFWVTQVSGVRWALELAIDTARIVASNSNAEAEDVRLALEELTAAYNAARAAKQPGGPDMSDLLEKIEQAKALLDILEVSDDGTDISQDKYWVTSELKQALLYVLEDAEKLADSTGVVTVKEVESALEALFEAYNVVSEAKGRGTYGIVPEDRAALGQAISAAKDKRDGVIQAENGSDIYFHIFWANEAMFTALKNVLAEAQAVYDDEDAEQEEIDDMAKRLKTATAAFVPQRGLLLSGTFGFTFEGPGNENITLEGGQSISWVRNESLSVSVRENFDSYEWFVNTKPRPDWDGKQGIVLQARDSELHRGSNTLTLGVTRGGVPFTKTLRFTVE